MIKNPKFKINKEVLDGHKFGKMPLQVIIKIVEKNGTKIQNGYDWSQYSEFIKKIMELLPPL